MNFEDFCKQLGLENNRILLVNPLQVNPKAFELEVAKNRCYYAYQPTGLLHLSKVIKEEGFDSEILDINFKILKQANEKGYADTSSWTSLDEAINEYEPAIVGISNFFAADRFGFEDAAIHAKKRKRIVIAGGANATYNSESLIKDGLVDFVFEREAEEKLRYFLKLLKGEEVEKQGGIVFRDGRSEGEVKIVQLEGTLNEVYKKINFTDYHKVGCTSPYSRMAGKDTKFATFLTNRGCGGGCKGYCDVRDFMGKGVRKRNVDDVKKEIEFLYNNGIRYFELLDDDFGRDKERAKNVLDELKKFRGLKWGANNGIIASTIDKEMMEKMRDSGCLGFKIGVESGNADVLKRIRKPGTLDSFEEFSKLAKNYPEMFIVDNYILGFNEETFKEMLDSFNFSLKMNLDWSSFAVYQQNASDNQKRDISSIGDFIPTKDGLEKKKAKVKTCLDIFNLEEIINKEQLREVWFTFNMLRNFVYNKNLVENPKKFIRWTEAIHDRYPSHPYISLFLSLAGVADGDKRIEKDFYEKTINNLNGWEDVLKGFYFNDVLSNFPRSREETIEAVNYLRSRGKYE